MYKESLVNILFPVNIDAAIGRQLWFSLFLEPNRKIIDIGGGEGFMTMGYPTNTPPIILDDFSGVPPSRSKPIGAIQGDAHEVPFPDNSFDIAIVADIIEHLTDPDKTLREAARVAKDFILVSTPYEYEWGYGSPAFNIGGHMRYYTRDSFHRVLEDAGLEFRPCKLMFSGISFWMAQAWAKDKPDPGDGLKSWADRQSCGIRFWVFGDMELYVATKETQILDLDGGICLRIPIKKMQAHIPTPGKDHAMVVWRTWPERDREPL